MMNLEERLEQMNKSIDDLDYRASLEQNPDVRMDMYGELYLLEAERDEIKNALEEQYRLEHDDDGQPSELQENQDFAHDDDMSNMSPNDDGTWS